MSGHSMLRASVLGTLCAAVTAAVAQPELGPSAAPQIGDVFPYRNVAYLDIPATGENVTWDLSGLGTSVATLLSCTAPSASPFADEFPTATILLQNSGVSQFMRADADGLRMLGVHRADINVLVHYTDEYLYIPFPCTYGTVLNDTYAGGYTYMSTAVTTTGQIAFEATGYGTLILPWGSIDNVLRLSGTDVGHDTFDATDVTSASTITYFFRPDFGSFLLKTIDFRITRNGDLIQSGQALSYLATAPTGTEELTANTIGVDVFPVPARDRLTVTYALGGGRTAAIRLFDPTGREVRLLNEHIGDSGVQRAELAIDGLPAGMYLLEVRDDHGQRGVRRVVID